MSVVNNRVALTNLVSMEALTTEEVLGLINRGSEYKAGKVVISDHQRILLPIYSLKTPPEPISLLKWLRRNSA